MPDTILNGDFTVYYAADNNQKRIEWTGTDSGTRTVNELYSAILKLFDDTTQMDDKIPIQAVTPDIYRIINQWFIDDATVEHLTGGSLFSQGWVDGTDEHVLVIGYAPTTEFETVDIGRTILGGTTGDTGTILDFNTGRDLLWIRPDDATTTGDEFDDPDESYTINNDSFDQVWQFEDPSTYVDETADANDATNANWDIFPATEGTGDAVVIGFSQQFSKVVFDNANGTAGTDGGSLATVWEYWDGSAWTALSGVTDGTAVGGLAFTASVSDGQELTYTIPTDWATKSENGSALLYYIRCRITAGTYGTNPVYDQGFVSGVGAGSFASHERHGEASAAGESAWAGVTSIGAIQPNTKAYIFQESPDQPAGSFIEEKVVATKGTDSWWPQEGQLDILLKTKEADSVFGPNPDAPSSAIATFFMRQYSKTYSHFIGESLGTAGGNTVVPFSTGDDLNNTTGHRRFTTDAETGGGWGTSDVDTVIRLLNNNNALQVWQVEDSPSTFTDQTTEFNDATAANWTVFPATEAVNDYAAIGFDQQFNTLVLDNAGGTAGVDGGSLAITWEYWDGTAWTALSNVVDGTSNFTTATADGQVVTWDLPTDWERTALDSSLPMYFVRARISAGSFSTNPIYDQGFIRFSVNQAVITDVTGTGPNYTVDYYLIGDQTDYVNNDVVEDELSTKSMTLDANPTDVGPATLSGSDPVFGATTEDINNGNGARPYSIRIDPTVSNNLLTDIYERMKYLTRRGSTTILLGQDGEEYLGNELQIEYTSQAGGDFTEGIRIYDQTTDAVGILVADHDDGTTGDVILKAVRGTFSSGPISHSPSASQSLGQVWVFDDSAGTFVDETTDAGSAGGGDVPLVSDQNDILYVGAAEVFEQLNIDIATAMVLGGATAQWQYWDGTTWANLESVTGFTDNTSDLTIGTGFSTVEFPPPLDWTARSVNNSAVLYYVRHIIQTANATSPATLDEIQVLDLVTATISSTRTIVPVSAAPFGTFAGGNFFGAPGVTLTSANLDGGDVQSYQLIDDDGVTQVPPNTIAITVDNLVSGDSVAVFRRTGSDINKTQFTLAASNDLGNTSVVVNETIDADNPTNANSKIRLISDNNVEHRYRYASYSGSTFTLATASTGTATAGSTLTTISDGSATFVTDGVEPGDMVRNTTDGASFSVVVSVDGENDLTVTDNGVSWSSQAYSVNTLVENYTTNNNAYVPLIERQADATSESNTLVFSTSFDIRAVVRRSSTATEILPFEQDTTVTGATTVTTIRNTDDIIT